MSDSTAARGISVTGHGRASAPPDLATLDIGVSALAASVESAVAEAASVAEDVLAALRSRGADELQTKGYSVQPEYSHDREHRRLDGYRVTNSVAAKVRRLDRVGETLDAAAGAGGDRIVVSGVSFSLENREALETAARRQAWQDAAAKAAQLAALARVTLGSPTLITESAGGPSPRLGPRAAMLAETATPVEPGEVTASVTLEVTFDIDA